MKIEIDVSGSDIFQDNYSICISDGTGNIMGFKFDQGIIDKLKSNWQKEKYNKCPYCPNAGKFKVRIYRVILRYLIKELFKKNKNKNKEITVNYCRDFPSHENGITQSIKHRIENIHKRKLKRIYCARLPKNSDAHVYAYMMNKDKYNYLRCYVKISLKDIEQGLIFHEHKK